MPLLILPAGFSPICSAVRVQTEHCAAAESVRRQEARRATKRRVFFIDRAKIAGERADLCEVFVKQRRNRPSFFMAFANKSPLRLFSSLAKQPWAAVA